MRNDANVYFHCIAPFNEDGNNALFQSYMQQSKTVL